MNNRRQLLIALGVGVLAVPFGSFAQPQIKIWRVAFLAGRHVDFLESDNYYGPFRQGMRELGYVDGKNLVIEWRSAGGNNERLPGLATELVGEFELFINRRTARELGLTISQSLLISADKVIE